MPISLDILEQVDQQIELFQGLAILGCQWHPPGDRQLASGVAWPIAGTLIFLQVYPKKQPNYPAYRDHPTVKTPLDYQVRNPGK